MWTNLVTLSSCFVCTAYLVLACLSFPEARALLNNHVGFEDDGSVVVMPLIFCDFETIEQTGSVISFDTATQDNCTTLDFLVNSAAASLIISAVAVLFYLVATIFYRCEVKVCLRWVKKPTLLGFALFLIFILVQSAIASWALASEVKRYIEYTDALFTKLGYYDTYNFDEIKAHGNDKWLWSTGSAAILAAASLLLDALVAVLCDEPREEARNSVNTDFNANLKSLEMSSASNTDSVSPAGEVNMAVELPETNSPQTWSTL